MEHFANCRRLSTSLKPCRSFDELKSGEMGRKDRSLRPRYEPIRPKAVFGGLRLCVRSAQEPCSSADARSTLPFDFLVRGLFEDSLLRWSQPPAPGRLDEPPSHVLGATGHGLGVGRGRNYLLFSQVFCFLRFSSFFLVAHRLGPCFPL